MRAEDDDVASLTRGRGRAWFRTVEAAHATAMRDGRGFPAIDFTFGGLPTELDAPGAATS
jgi:hypothetical protein